VTVRIKLSKVDSALGAGADVLGGATIVTDVDDGWTVSIVRPPVVAGAAPGMSLPRKVVIDVEEGAGGVAVAGL
jgi:hypothetical protein